MQHELLVLLAHTPDAMVRLIVNFERGHRGIPNNRVSGGQRDPMCETLRMRQDNPIFRSVLEQVKNL